MAVQSQVITCPTGQWTSIAENLQRRKALRVQSPETTMTCTYTMVPMVSGNTATIAAANPLRRMVAFAVALDTDMYVVSRPTGSGIPEGQIQIRNSLCTDAPPPLVIGENWGQWAQQAWTGHNNGGANAAIGVFEEIWTCRAIVLGINVGVPTYVGPFGTTPAGLWTSPDLKAGPAIFSLSEQADADLVKQEWFVWPIGSGNVKIQVYQSFDDSIPAVPITQDAMKVRLPQLSPMALSHLAALKRRLLGELPDDL